MRRLTLPIGLICALMMISTIHAQSGNSIPEEKPKPLKQAERPYQLTENTKLAHIQSYLAAIIMSANDLGEVSPLEALEIKEKAIALMKESKEVRTPKEEESLISDAQEMYQDIFLDERSESISSFKDKTIRTITEISDALPLLIEDDSAPLKLSPSQFDRFSQKLDDLLIDIKYIDDDIDLALWLFTFQETADSLRAEITLPTVNVVKADLHALIVRLRSYLKSVEGMGIELATTEDQLSELEVELEGVRTERGLQKFISKLEEHIGSLSGDISDSIDATQS